MSASAAIYHVTWAGDDDASGLSWEEAKQTVGAAISISQPGDEIWVTGGLYAEKVVLPPGRALYGGFLGDEPDRKWRNWIYTSTVLDGGGTGPTVVIDEGAGPDTVLDGFVIQNGYGNSGGGLEVIDASPRIQHCTFKANRTDNSGGGAYFFNSTASVSQCVFQENQAKINGGGVFIENSDMVLSGCVFFRNSAGTDGGGLYTFQGTVTLASGTLVENVSGSSGGAVAGSGMKLHNNIVAFNSTGITLIGPNEVRNNCVYGNPGGDYFDTPDSTGTDGNISADPQFVHAAYGNLHLRQGSPCIDTGDDTIAVDDSDLDDQIRTLGAGMDIGADEFDSADTWAGTGRRFYVSPTGRDWWDGIYWGQPKKTIGAALAAAQPGDEIWVAAGTYTGPITLKPGVAIYGGFEGYEWNLADRKWRSNVTILDGLGAGRVVTVPDGAGPSTILDGLTIQNGNTNENGGGLYAGLAAPTVRNCTFFNNFTFGFGGGIYLGSGALTLSGCTFVENTGIGHGGGVYLPGGSHTVTNCVFRKNMAGTSGTAIAVSQSTIRMVNNTVAGNLSGSLGSVYIAVCKGVFANNIVAFNDCGVFTGFNTVEWRNNCVYGNSSSNYHDGGNRPDPTGTDGNVSVDPLFVDQVQGDIHLQENSPCVDAGDATLLGGLNVDMDGRHRVTGTQVDIGADEMALPELVSVSLDRTSVVSGATATGTVTLSGKAPSGGLAVTLESWAPYAVTVPTTVTVTAGQSSATFTVTALEVEWPFPATIAALLEDATKTAELTVTPAPPTVDAFTPSFGCVGAEVTITGTRFAGATAVTFNGTPATVFTVVSPTQIKAKVPAGATTGKVAVTAPTGTGTSSADFNVVLWSARDVAQSTDGTTRTLVTNGAAVMVVKWNGSALQPGTPYTPAAGWSPVGIAADSAGGTFLLWKKGVGSYQLWCLDAAGARSTALPVQSASGWTATDVSAAGDGSARVLLVNGSGQVKVARVSGSSTAYGPTYTPGAGWCAVGIATGTDNKTRLLWRGATQYQIWTLNASCALETAHPARSAGAWTARDVSQSGDGTTRVLMENGSGQVRVNSLSGSALTQGTVYTPTAGWYPVGIAADPDSGGKARLLWQRDQGHLNLWTLGASGALQSASSMGTY